MLFPIINKDLKNFAEMKNIIKDKYYCAKLLLNSIGMNVFKMSWQVSWALATPKKPAELGYDALISLLEFHFAHKKNVLIAQYQFLSIYQTEQIAEYVTTLRTNIGDCDFISLCECKVSLADIFLRVQFIRGIKDNSIRETNFKQIFLSLKIL